MQLLQICVNVHAECNSLQRQKRDPTAGPALHACRELSNVVNTKYACPRTACMLQICPCTETDMEKWHVMGAGRQPSRITFG